jgi:DNA-binding NtrC family response regulator
MEPRLILLYSRDPSFDGVLAQALFGTGAVVLIARSVNDALQIVCRRGRELAFALMDFEGGCRGVTLLSAIHTCFEHLPILVTISEEAQDVTTVAYANGARACVNRSVPPAQLADTISDVIARDRQPVAA